MPQVDRCGLRDFYEAGIGSRMADQNEFIGHSAFHMSGQFSVRLVYVGDTRLFLRCSRYEAPSEVHIELNNGKKFR